MTDLPAASTPPVAGGAARPTTNASPRIPSACNRLPQQATCQFQDALEQELRLDGLPAPAADVAAAAANEGSSRKPGADAAQTAADASLELILAGMPPMPAAYAAGTNAGIALVPGPREDAPAPTPRAPTAEAGLPRLAAAAGVALPGKIAVAAAGGIASRSTQRQPGPIFPIVPAAADVSLPADPAPGASGEAARPGAADLSELIPLAAPTAADRFVPVKFARAGTGEIARSSPAAQFEPTPLGASVTGHLVVPGMPFQPGAGELHREAAFDASPLEQHPASPTPTMAILAGSAPAELAQVPIATLQTRVGEHGWGQGLGDKLIWMAGQHQQVAQLHLNPPELGPLRITLTLDHDQASAQFVSAHVQVREAIETAMPRLREMLADSGITLGDTSVSTGAFREQARQQQQPGAYPAVLAAAAMDPGAAARGEHLLRRTHGLVDTFA